MKTKVTKEQALKAILFMTVATTLSWPSPNLHHSVDLASASEVLSVDPATPQPSEGQKPLPMTPSTLMLATGKVKMPTRPVPLGKNINPITKKPLMRSTGSINVCGVKLQINLDEKVEGNSVFTSVVVHEVNRPNGAPALPDVLVRSNGTFAENGATKESIHTERGKAFTKQILDESTAKMTAVGRCGDAAESDDTAEEQPEDDAPETAGAPRTKHDDSDAIANCMIDGRSHRAHANSSVLQCNMDKLDQLEQKAKSDSRHSSRYVSEYIRLIKNGIYPQLRNMLMDNKTDRQDEAQDAIDSLITRLEKMGDKYDTSSSEITKLTSSLNGLKSGGDAFQRATEMKKDVDDLKKEIQAANRQGGQNGQQGQVPQYLYQRIQDLQSKLQSEVAEGPIQELNEYSRDMNPRDVKMLTGPYEQVQRDLQAMTGQQNGQGQNGQQIGQNGQQIGPNGQPINGGSPFGGQQYGPNGQLINGGGQFGGVQYGPNGQIINGGGQFGGVQYGPNGQIINAGYGAQGIQGVGYGAPGILGASYAPMYQQQLAYTNGGVLNPQLLGQGSALLGRQGSPWANQGLISNGAFQNAGVAASILPAQYTSSALIGGAAASPFRNGSGFGNSGGFATSGFGNSGSVFGGTGISGSIFGSAGGISAGISFPQPPPVNPGIYGGGFSGSGYYNRQLPVMTQSSRFPPSVLPLANSSYGLTSTTSAVGTPFRR